MDTSSNMENWIAPYDPQSGEIKIKCVLDSQPTRELLNAIESCFSRLGYQIKCSTQRNIQTANGLKIQVDFTITVRTIH